MCEVEPFLVTFWHSGALKKLLVQQLAVRLSFLQAAIKSSTVLTDPLGSWQPTPVPISNKNEMKNHFLCYTKKQND